MLSRDLFLLTLNMKLLFLISTCVFSSRLNVNKTLTKLIQTACLFFFGGFVAVFSIPEVIKVSDLLLLLLLLVCLCNFFFSAFFHVDFKNVIEQRLLYKQCIFTTSTRNMYV